MSKKSSPTISDVSVTPTSGPGGTLFSAAVSVSGHRPYRITYQWKLDGADISGATGSSYVAALSGRLTVRVTVTNHQGSDTRESEPVAVEPPAATPVVTSLAIEPSSGGVGDTFVAVADVSGVPRPMLTYRWILAGATVSGGTGQTYIAAEGGPLAVELTALNSEGSDSRQSDDVEVAAAPAPAAIADAAITPTTGVVGDRFTAVVEATGIPAPELAFQWLLDSAAIPGATEASHISTRSGELSAVVVAHNGVGEPARAETAAVTVAAAGSAGAILVSDNGGALRIADGGGRILINKAV